MEMILFKLRFSVQIGGSLFRNVLLINTREMLLFLYLIVIRCIFDGTMTKVCVFCGFCLDSDERSGNQDDDDQRRKRSSRQDG